MTFVSFVRLVMSSSVVYSTSSSIIVNSSSSSSSNNNNNSSSSSSSISPLRSIVTPPACASYVNLLPATAPAIFSFAASSCKEHSRHVTKRDRWKQHQHRRKQQQQAHCQLQMRGVEVMEEAPRCCCRLQMILTRALGLCSC